MKKQFKYIFFRDDDVYKMDGKLTRLLNIFAENNVPLTLSLIPEKLSANLCGQLLIYFKNESAIDMAQHGLTHNNYSENKYSKYEFGIKRSYEEQESDIRKGAEILKKIFGIKPKIFVPPWNGFDNETLKALKKNGFSFLSTDTKHFLPHKKDGIKNICTSIYWNKKSLSGAWSIEDPKNIINKIIFGTRKFIGVEMHHEHFKDNAAFANLDYLVKELKRNDDIKFIRLIQSDNDAAQKDAAGYASLIYYLTYQFVPKPLSLIPTRNNVITEKYDFSYIKNIKLLRGDENTISKQLHAHLMTAIENLLPKDRNPIGILLSGGIDSAAILHLLREATDRKIYSITATFCKTAANIPISSSLSKKYRTIHHTLLIPPHSIKTLEQIYTKNIPQPIGDGGFLPTCLMIKKLKRVVDTIFAGDGADCLFSGLKIHKINSIINAKKYPNGAFEHYRFGEIFLDNKELIKFFGEDKHDIDLAAPLKDLSRKINIDDVLKRQTFIDLNFLVKNRMDYLLYSSKIYKAKIALPFLEKNFVDFAIKIPSKYLIKGAIQKYILKKAFENKLPREIVYREKEGFRPPFKIWYATNKDFVLGKLIKSVGLGIPKDYIKYLVSIIPKSDDYRIGMKVWIILNLVCWHKGMDKDRI